MESVVERTPHHVPARVMSRRSFLMLAGSTTSLVLLAACQGAAPAAPPAETQSPLAARTLAPISAAQSTPASTAAPAPAAAPWTPDPALATQPPAQAIAAIDAALDGAGPAAA